MRRRRIVLTIVAALALPAGGCGSVDTGAINAYVDAINRAETTFHDRLEPLALRLKDGGTVPEERRTLGDMQAVVAGVTRAIAAAVPPGNVRALHARLVTAVRAYGTAIAKARQDLAPGTLASAAKARTRLSTAATQAATEIRTAATAINTALHT